MDIGNLFGAITSFLMGIIMLTMVDRVMRIVIALQTNVIVAMILTITYLLIAIILIFYFPMRALHQEKQTTQETS